MRAKHGLPGLAEVPPSMKSRYLGGNTWRKVTFVALQPVVGFSSRLVEKMFRLSQSRAIGDLAKRGVVSFGSYTYGTPRVYASRNPVVGLEPGASLRIGSFCSIADGVEILTGGEHRTDWVSTFPLNIFFGTAAAWRDGHPSSKGDVIIGNDVWIGLGAKILSGVTIGDGAVVGAFTVVSRDVRPYAIVVGNPAREVRRRFPDEQVEKLLRIQWWNWSAEVIAERIPFLSSDRIDDFLQRWA